MRGHDGGRGCNDGGAAATGRVGEEGRNCGHGDSRDGGNIRLVATVAGKIHVGLEGGIEANPNLLCYHVTDLGINHR